MQKTELIQRTKSFGLQVMQLCDNLPPGAVGWNLAKQLMRSGTSIGANYREAQRSRTRTEFKSKISICQQEADETQYWLDLIAEYDGFAPAVRQIAVALRDEVNQLCRIMMAIGERLIEVQEAPQPSLEP